MAAATTARMSRVRRTERLHFAAGLRLPSACRSSGTRTSVRTVDREWLERRLSNGLSVDAIAADAGCSASSVGYWINHFGLWPPQRAQSGRGGLEADELRSLVQQGLSVRQMAAACGVSATTIRRWLRRHDLRTSPSRYARRDGPKPHEILRECPTHGWTGIPSSGSRGWLSLRPLQHRPRQPTTPSRQGAARRRGRRFMHALRLRPVSGRAAVPPPRAARETVSHLGGRAHAFPGSAPRRGRKVLATLRQLPRGGGSWHNGLATAAAQHRSGVAQW